MAADVRSDGLDAGEGLHYLRRSRTLSHSIICILPLLILYQCGIVQGGHTQRVLVEVWLAHQFQSLGQWSAHVVNVALFVALIAALWRGERSGPLSLHVIAVMPAEACVYALALYRGCLVLTRAILDGDVLFGAGLDRFAPYLLGLGAGVYEELVFRFALLGLGAVALNKVFRWTKPFSFTVALVVSSLAFAAVHHLGASGEPLGAEVFLFRVVAGALLGGVFLVRGLGVAVWTHAIYNVMVIYHYEAAASMPA